MTPVGESPRINPSTTLLDQSVNSTSTVSVALALSAPDSPAARVAFQLPESLPYWLLNSHSKRV